MYSYLQSTTLAVGAASSEPTLRTASLALQAVDQRIANAPIHEIEELVKFRATVLAQDAGSKYLEAKFEGELLEKKQKHWVERTSLKSTVALSAAAMGIGLTLCLVSPVLVVPGLFMLGGGLSYAAPSYVRKNIATVLRLGGKSDE